MARPQFSRQRSNSVPTVGLVNVSGAEATILFSAAERATARRKRPVSVDSPGPSVDEQRIAFDTIPSQPFNFSTPSRLGLGQSPLRSVQRTGSLGTISSEPPSAADVDTDEDEEDVEPTPLASTFSLNSAVTPTSPQLLTSPLSPKRNVDNPVLKAYADSLFTFTQTRLNNAAPETLATLGLKREPSPIPPTPELDVQELTSPKPRRPLLTSQFSDWSSNAPSSVFGPSSPPSPSEPRTPDDQSGLMTPDSFFAAEITPRVAQTAAWAATTTSLRQSITLADGSFFLDSPTIGQHQYQRSRTSSVTSSEAFSYFAGFDGTTDAAGTRLSNDLSPYARHARLQNSGLIPRSQPGSSASNHPPYLQRAHSPYGDMMTISRTPSWQVSAMG